MLIKKYCKFDIKKNKDLATLVSLLLVLDPWFSSAHNEIKLQYTFALRVSHHPFIFFLVKKHILQYQSGSIGLFPLYTSGKNEESHVRDNVYCAMAVWALGLAYRLVYTNLCLNLLLLCK